MKDPFHVNTCRLDNLLTRLQSVAQSVTVVASKSEMESNAETQTNATVKTSPSKPRQAPVAPVTGVTVNEAAAATDQPGEVAMLTLHATQDGKTTHYLTPSVQV